MQEGRLTIRLANHGAIQRLWELRKKSILELAPKGMTVSDAHTWATKMTLQGMETRFRETEIWIAEFDGLIVGWIAVRNDYLDGLYVDPAFAEKGIGSRLLVVAETSMRNKGIQVVRLESSVNAETFYRRRGYSSTEESPGDNSIRLRKQL